MVLVQLKQIENNVLDPILDPKVPLKGLAFLQPPELLFRVTHRREGERIMKVVGTMRTNFYAHFRAPTPNWWREWTQRTRLSYAVEQMTVCNVIQFFCHIK